MIQRNDPCWCGSGFKWKKCHAPQEAPSENPKDLATYYFKKYHIVLKTPEQIEGIREASHLTATILDKTCAAAKAGVSTLELNDYAHQLHMEAHATPACLHYGSPPFPKSICTSLNEVICHGIPDQTKLQPGDILNVDVSSIYKGYYGDCSRMVIIGETTAERQLVVDVAYESLQHATHILKPGILLSTIGEVIEAYAHSKKCSVVSQFVGHGVGLQFHEEPQVAHNRNYLAIPLVPGMIFTIEPMINAGVREGLLDPYNHWTVRTADGRASAQWEYTLLITETGHEILTPWKK